MTCNLVMADRHIPRSVRNRRTKRTAFTLILIMPYQLHPRLFRRQALQYFAGAVRARVIHHDKLEAMNMRGLNREHAA